MSSSFFDLFFVTLCSELHVASWVGETDGPKQAFLSERVHHRCRAEGVETGHSARGAHVAERLLRKHSSHRQIYRVVFIRLPEYDDTLATRCPLISFRKHLTSGVAYLCSEVSELPRAVTGLREISEALCKSPKTSSIANRSTSKRGSERDADTNTDPQATRG